MDVTVVAQDSAAGGRASRREGPAISRSPCVAWLLAVGLVTGCGGVPLGADPNQAVIDAVARVLPAVVDVEVVAGGPAVLGGTHRD